MNKTLISANNLTKQFGNAKSPIIAVNSVQFSIDKGSFTIILGKSGSGKSTLLNMLTGLDVPTSGELIVDDKNLSKLNSAQLAKYRSSIGVVFQFYNLLPNLSAIENIMMSAWAGNSKKTKKDAEILMEKFGLSHRINADVKTLSGGEKQRVALCRSLLNNPQILFCDEPTGALDSANESEVMDILQELNTEGVTVVLVTHAPEFQNRADQVITMKDGKIDTISLHEKIKSKANTEVFTNKIMW